MLLCQFVFRRKKDTHSWCSLRESFNFFPRLLARKFKSHQRSVSVTRFDKKLDSSIIRYATQKEKERRRETRDLEVYIVKECRESLWARKGLRIRMGIDERGQQRNGEYPANSCIVNYVMQISERHAASAIQQGICDLHLASAAVVFIIWNILCHLSVLSELS